MPWPEVQDRERLPVEGLTSLSMEEEIAHLRSLDPIGLQSRWQSVVGARPRSTCPGICCPTSSHIAFRPMRSAISMLGWFNF